MSFCFRVWSPPSISRELGFSRSGSCLAVDRESFVPSWIVGVSARAPLFRGVFHPGPQAKQRFLVPLFFGPRPRGFYLVFGPLSLPLFLSPSDNVSRVRRSPRPFGVGFPFWTTGIFPEFFLALIRGLSRGQRSTGLPSVACAVSDSHFRGFTGERPFGVPGFSGRLQAPWILCS